MDPQDLFPLYPPLYWVLVCSHGSVLVFSCKALWFHFIWYLVLSSCWVLTSLHGFGLFSCLDLVYSHVVERRGLVLYRIVRNIANNI